MEKETLNKYRGMNFLEWCELDQNDERKINYNYTGVFEGRKEVKQFSSEEEVDLPMILRLREATIKDVALVNDEWFIVLEQFPTK